MVVKALGFWVFGFLFLMAVSSVALANEGTAVLRPEAGFEGECYVASVFIDGSYRVLASCRNLPTALGAESNRLLLWRETEGGKILRVGELSRGKLSATVRNRFVALFVTSEASGSPKAPKGPILARGGLMAIDFAGKGGAGQIGKATPTPIARAVTTASEKSREVKVEESGSKIAGVFSGVAKAVGLGFVLLLVVVGVLGFLARKKGL